MRFDYCLNINSHTLSGTMTLDHGECLLIYGDNGVGKSSLLNHLFENFSDIAICPQPPMEVLVDIEVIGFIQQLKQSAQIDDRHFTKVVQMLNLESLYAKRLSFLSGGERQLVKIFSTLIFDKSIYFFDEPLLNLDLKNTKKFISVIEQLKHMSKKIMIVEHKGEKLENVVTAKLRLEYD